MWFVSKCCEEAEWQQVCKPKQNEGGIFWVLALTIDVKFLARIQYEYGEFVKIFCKALLDDK